MAEFRESLEGYINIADMSADYFADIIPTHVGDNISFVGHSSGVDLPTGKLTVYVSNNTDFNSNSVRIKTYDVDIIGATEFYIQIDNTYRFTRLAYLWTSGGVGDSLIVDYFIKGTR
jgi:hypothetical protein